jgi:hypothetical protein
MAYGGLLVSTKSTDYPEKVLEFRGPVRFYEKGKYYMELCQIWDDNHMQPEYDDDLVCIITLDGDAKREEKQLLKSYGVKTIDEVDEDDYEDFESELGEIIKANMEGKKCKILNESNAVVHKAEIYEFIIIHD